MYIVRKLLRKVATSSVLVASFIALQAVAADFSGMYEDAELASWEYSKMPSSEGPNMLWELARNIGKDARINVNVSKIRKKYADVRRMERHSTLAT